MRHSTGRASGNHSLSKVTALALFIASVVVIIFVMAGGAKAHGWFTGAKDPVTGLGCCYARCENLSTFTVNGKIHRQGDARCFFEPSGF